MNTKERSIKKYILLGVAIALTVAAVLFTVLGFFSGKSGRYVATGIYVVLAVFSLWGAPFAYYFFAKQKCESRAEIGDGCEGESSVSSTDTSSDKNS